MRSLDKNYITPVLRSEGLLFINNDGVMMTRTLAENYPYTKYFKGQSLIDQGKTWLNLVDIVNSGSTSPKESLQYLISLLINRSDSFNQLVEAMKAKEEVAFLEPTINQVSGFVDSHIQASNHGARLFEISIHAFAQALFKTVNLGELRLSALTQMRSANKKHGNIGDVEFVTEERSIIEAWDAKHGITELEQQVEELAEKMREHSHVRRAGFISNEAISINDSLQSRVSQVSKEFNAEIHLLTFEEWVSKTFEFYSIDGNNVSEQVIAREWFLAYVGTLSQRRRDIAPVDEPCHEWLEKAIAML